MPSRDPRSILVSCGACGHLFGRMLDDGQAEAMDTHYQTCTAYLHGEGLIKERSLVYAFEDDDA